MKITFTVYGHPEAKGSMKTFIPRGGKFPVAVPDSPNQLPWQQQATRTVIEAAKGNGGEIIPRGLPVAVRLAFFLQRPPSKPKRVTRPTTKPDIDKLTRLIFDSMTGVLFEDDSQVCDAILSKHYGVPERVEVTVAAEVEALPLLENTTMELFA